MRQGSGRWVERLKESLVPERRVGFVASMALLAILGLAFAATTSQQTVASSGTVKVVGVSVFWDKACTNQVTSIAWGLITPGTPIKKYVYVRNDGTTTGTLSMSYGSWNPSSAATYFTLSWNASSYSLAKNKVVCAALTFTARSNVTGITDFSFAILIKASG